jgi:hypothetical protein
MAGLYSEMYSLVKSGRVFHGTTAAAGVLIPISNTTGPTFGLWNPQGNPYNAAILSVRVGWFGTTGAPGAILYNTLTGAGNAIGTAAPLTAFTSATPTNAFTGFGYASTVKFTPSAATLTTAGSVVGVAGMSQLTTTGATTSAPMWELVDDMSSMWVVAPGTFFYLTGSAALLSLFDIEMVWAELQ